MENVNVYCDIGPQSLYTSDERYAVYFFLIAADPVIPSGIPSRTTSI